MGWRDVGAPLRMQRVALVAPRDSVRDMLVRVADAGTVEVDQRPRRPRPGRRAGAQARSGVDPSAAPRLCRATPDLGELERAGRTRPARG